MKKTDQTVLLFKKSIFSSSKESLLNSLREKLIRSKKPLVIFTPNPEQLVLARKNPDFSKHLASADYLIPDGIGLIWAAKLLNWFGRGKAIRERITGIDLATDFLEWAAREDWSVLLLGGKGYHQAGDSELQLKTSLPKSKKLKLQWLEGYQNVARRTTAEEKTVRQTISKLKPQLVLVAFGAPQQEQWVVEHRDLLTKAGTKIVMVVGGSFDVLFGKLKRAPLWMRALGLEWLYRLLQEPHRWRRQLALLEFISLTFKQALSGKK